MGLEDERVIVTGGAGFIGAHLSRALVERGATVDVIDNLSVGNNDRVPEGANVHAIDIQDGEIPDLFRELQPSVVLHLAAIHYIPYCNEHPEETFNVNVIGTRNLLEAARNLEGLEQVIYASSAAVYPPRETAHKPDDDPDPMDIYGRTKLVGEDLLKLFADETGIPATSARLFNVYGPDETNPHLVPAIMDQLKDGNTRIELGNLTPKRDLVHVSDVVRALLRMTTDVEAGYHRYNVGSGTAHSVREIVGAVSRALGEDIDISQDPERVRESDRPHLEADIDKTIRELGWRPEVELEEGLDTLIEARGIR